MIARASHEQPSQTLLQNVNPATFAVNFNRTPFTVGHSLTDHPMFDLEALIELSRQLPKESVEYNSGDLAGMQNPNHTPMSGLSIKDSVQRFEECKSWMLLKNVEQHPMYKRLLDCCLDEIEEATSRIAPGMTQREGSIFISSPGSVTPYHIDTENNFRLQIRGTKQVHMYDPMDRKVLSEEAIENFFAGGHRNLEFDDSLHGRGYWFQLKPGEGLHFPVVAPHWVENGDEVSISFSITFQTDASMQRQTLHRVNRQIRKLGLTPSPVGFNEKRDNAKYHVVKTLRAPMRLLGRKHHSAQVSGA